MYVALKHIGGKYTPGEILPDDLPDDTLKWLFEAGAIRKTAPAPYILASQENTPPEFSEQQREQQTLNEDTDAADDENTPPELDVEDEIDEDAEVPEIDVMDGVVAENEDIQEAPDPKPLAKKPGGRRKNK